MFFKKKQYLSWEDYSDKINQIDHISFISQTASQSIHNYWKNQERGVLPC